MPVSRLLDYARCAHDLGTSPRAQLEIFWRLTKNARARAGLARHHTDVVYPLNTRYGTIYLRDNWGDITNIVGLLHRGVYRVQGIAGEGVVIDAGANIGLFAAWVRAHDPSRRIICFEPIPGCADLIERNCPGATVVRVALDRGSGSASLRVDSDGVIASSIPTRWHTAERVFPTTSLDEYLDANGVGPIAFMKIDVEGMELNVLDGGAAALRRTRQVAMETHGEANHAASQERLRRAGLTIDAAPFSGWTGMVYASRRA